MTGSQALMAAAALCITAPLHAQTHAAVQVTAVPQRSTVAPGDTFRVALRLRIPAGCHISWTNPGRTGLPTTLAWRTPSGVTVVATEWPYPDRDETAGFVSHVYRGDIVIVTRFRTDASLHDRKAVLGAELSWGLCGRTCLPQRETVEVPLSVADGPGRITRAWRAISSSFERLPAAETDLTVRAVARGDSTRLSIEGPSLSLSPGGEAVFFPASTGEASVLRVRRAEDGVVLMLPGIATRELAGVLVADHPWLSGAPQRALAIDLAVQQAPSSIDRTPLPSSYPRGRMKSRYGVYAARPWSSGVE